jgi:hypothetical protein
MIPKDLQYQTQIWAMMLKQVRLSSPLAEEIHLSCRAMGRGMWK